MNWRLHRARAYYAGKMSRGYLCWLLVIAVSPQHWAVRWIWWWALPFAGDYAYFDDPYVASIRHRHLRRLAARA